jgi:hypothetical protein
LTPSCLASAAPLAEYRDHWNELRAAVEAVNSAMATA